MPQLQVIDIQEIKKRKKDITYLYEPYTGSKDADYTIVFMDIETKKQFEIYVPEYFKEMEENWFCIGEIWESEIEGVYEGDGDEDIFLYGLDCEEKHWNLYYEGEFKELGEFNEEDFEEMDDEFGNVDEDEDEELEEGNYVIKTDKGYLKGDLRVGVEFVEKEHARVFDELEIEAYWDSICVDLTEFFGVTTLETELAS